MCDCVTDIRSAATSNTDVMSRCHEERVSMASMTICCMQIFQREYTWAMTGLPTSAKGMGCFEESRAGPLFLMATPGGCCGPSCERNSSSMGICRKCMMHCTCVNPQNHDSSILVIFIPVFDRDDASTRMHDGVSHDNASRECAMPSQCLQMQNCTDVQRSTHTCDLVPTCSAISAQLSPYSSKPSSSSSVS